MNKKNMTTFNRFGSQARRRHAGNAGFTLVEICVALGIIAVIAAAILYGYAGYREATNQNLCVQNQSRVQTAMRSYSNLQGLNTGSSLTETSFIGTGLPLEVAPVCRSGGTYTYATTVPATGTAYVTCSLATHVPQSTSTW